MKTIGIVSYNIYANFTNYGSALQSWALYTTINRIMPSLYKAKLVDYCPNILLDKDALNPIKNMWDQDDKSKHYVEVSMDAIRTNYYKFMNFYNNRFDKTRPSTAKNFDEVMYSDGVDSYVCGSDTIFCIDEFGGFDDGYYANFDSMMQNSISYAASFGDINFSEENLQILNKKLLNFKSLGIRENDMIPYIKEHVDIPVSRVIDPTLLLTQKDYDTLACDRLVEGDYLLLYSRRYNQKMWDFAEKIAKERNLKIVDISLRAADTPNHIAYYEAGVEEFLSLVKYASCVVTNSFHGIILSVQYGRQFYGFTRAECNTKIDELMTLFGLDGYLMVDGSEEVKEIDYTQVYPKIEIARDSSLNFLKSSLAIL